MIEFKKLEGKNVRIICNDGQIFEGNVGDYIFADDNVNGKESIILDPFPGFPLYGCPVEFLEEEIKTIKVIE
jgi:hypothetical protein